MVLAKSFVYGLISATLVTCIPVLKTPSAISIPLYTKKATTITERDFKTNLLSDSNEYYADIQVGTPSKIFSVIVDTGSALLWLEGEECPISECKNDRYIHSSSSTAIESDFILNITYADKSSVIGKMYYDDIQFAGLSLKNQLVGSSTTNGSLFENNFTRQPGGLLGLAPMDIVKDLNGVEYKHVPFVYQLFKDNLIPMPIFSYSLVSNDTVTVGELTLGGTNPSLYTGEVRFVPNIPFSDGSEFYWQAHAQDLRMIRGNGTIKSNDIIFDKSVAIYAVMDSGTTYTYANNQYAHQLYYSITGNNNPSAMIEDPSYWEIDCNLASSKDYIQLSLSHLRNITENDTAPLKLQVPISTFVQTFSGTASCGFSLLINEDLNSADQILFGQNFLKNFYIVSNMDSKNIGFAPVVGSSAYVVV